MEHALKYDAAMEEMAPFWLNFEVEILKPFKYHFCAVPTFHQHAYIIKVQQQGDKLLVP